MGGGGGSGNGSGSIISSGGNFLTNMKRKLLDVDGSLDAQGVSKR